MGHFVSTCNQAHCLITTSQDNWWNFPRLYFPAGKKTEFYLFFLKCVCGGWCTCSHLACMCKYTCERQRHFHTNTSMSRWRLRLTMDVLLVTFSLSTLLLKTLSHWSSSILPDQQTEKLQGPFCLCFFLGGRGGLRLHMHATMSVFKQVLGFEFRYLHFCMTGSLLTAPSPQLLPLNFDYSIIQQHTDRFPVQFSSPILYTDRPFLKLMTFYLFSEPLCLPLSTRHKGK